MLGIGPTALHRKSVLDKMLEEGIQSSVQAEKSEDGDSAWHILGLVGTCWHSFMTNMFLQQTQREHRGMMILRSSRRFF